MTTRATVRTGPVRTTGALRATPRTPARTPARTTARTPARTTAGSPARATPRPELRLVQGVTSTRRGGRPTSLLRNKRAPFVLLVVALLVGTTLGLLVLNTAIAVDSLKATQLRTANTQRQEQLQRLQQQVVSGGTPAEVARAAAAAGMVPAGVAAHLVIGPDGSAELRGTPQPAPAAGATPGGN